MKPPFKRPKGYALGLPCAMASRLISTRACGLSSGSPIKTPTVTLQWPLLRSVSGLTVYLYGMNQLRFEIPI